MKIKGGFDMNRRQRNDYAASVALARPARDVENGRQALRRIKAARIAGKVEAELRQEALPLLDGKRNVRARHELEVILGKLEQFIERNRTAIRPESLREKERRLTRALG